jgi:glucose/arabinose dehydrogenase
LTVRTLVAALVVARSSRRRDEETARPRRETNVSVDHRANDNHDGGQLQFGPDEHLYAGTGDGGSGGDPPNNSQNVLRRLGKLLRLNGSRWDVYTYGLRNPWRFSFNRANGDLYIGDVGAGSWEEIDYRPHSATGVVNYGWSAYEGLVTYNPPRLNHAGTLVKPVQVYRHNGGKCSVTGGYASTGAAPCRRPAGATSTATTARGRFGACASQAAGPSTAGAGRAGSAR